MRYLIRHTDECECQYPNRFDTHVETPEEVGVYLFGRDVLQHIVYEGECPYRFNVGDISLLEVLLTDFRAREIRAYLPCTVWAGNSDLVYIGDGESRTMINYFRWIRAMNPLGTHRMVPSTL